MELRHLRYFVAVAEEGHITRAAERLGMQQPPLSQQIKALETELKVQLFLRKARGVELTEAGRALFADAQALLAQLDGALERTRRTARGEQGRINVGMTPTAPFHPLVSQAVLAFRAAHPLVTVGIEEALSDPLIERLHQQQVDVAFIRNAIADPSGLTIVPLRDEMMVLALPKGHALAQGPDGRPVPLADLAGECFILYGPPGSGIHDRTIAACEAAGFTPQIGQRAPRITSTLGLIAAGLGVSLVPRSTSRMLMDGVAYRPVSGPVLPRALLSLAWRRGDASAVLARLVAQVRLTARETPEDA